jgi:hypothetical protein
MTTAVKEGLHTYTHRKGARTTDTKIINLIGTKSYVTARGYVKSRADDKIIKFKFSYACYNAGENFTGELFDGKKLNTVFNIDDLGITRDCSAYHIPTEDELKARIAMLTTEGIKFIKSLY